MPGSETSKAIMFYVYALESLKNHRGSVWQRSQICIILKIEYNYTQNMLDLIFKSKIRQKILLLFIYNPEKKYYINEIARLVKTSSGTAQREMEKLAVFDILVKNKKANVAYFSLNKSNLILIDLKRIIEKTIGLENILKKELEKNKKIAFSFLFGSYVRGTFRSDSDIDLYIVGNVAEDEIYKLIKKVEDIAGREIDYHMASVAEFKRNLKKSFFHKEILKNHIFLTGKRDEFGKIIKRPA